MHVLAVAPPGSYYDRGIGRLCPQGTYSDIYSGVSNTTYCTPCATGVTTPTEGSNSSGACSLAQPGYYMSGEGQADLCPVNTYNGQISNATSCTPCPYGERIQERACLLLCICRLGLAASCLRVSLGVPVILAADAVTATEGLQLRAAAAE